MAHTKPFDDENYINQKVDYSRPIAVPLSAINASASTDDEILKVKMVFLVMIGTNL